MENNFEPPDLDTSRLGEDQEFPIPTIPNKQSRRFFYCPREGCGSARLQILFYDIEINAFGLVCCECGHFQILPLPLIKSTKENKPRPRKSKGRPSYV